MCVIFGVASYSACRVGDTESRIVVATFFIVDIAFGTENHIITRWSPRGDVAYSSSAICLALSDGPGPAVLVPAVVELWSMTCSQLGKS